jgi:single-stranded-DNA-specific exonuclease
MAARRSLALLAAIRPRFGAGASIIVIVERGVPQGSVERLSKAGIHPVLSRLLAARGVDDPAQTELQIASLLPLDSMTGLAEAARGLADAIDASAAIVVVADYDCDGATACAVMIRGLRSMAARVDYLVPNRFEHGYGLTPAIVELVSRHPAIGRPAVIVTVDNGIASLDGIACARRLGIEVIVTDHHLPGPRLPADCIIVNPNQPACRFASKHLAGVGVAFYLLLAVRAELRHRGRFESSGEPALQGLLDLVALGTVADLVKLDHNNRILVAAGLRRIRGGKACAGVRALLEVAGREPRSCTAADLGYALGPRINAAGRLADISIGVECLLEDDFSRAAVLAAELDAINRQRRDRELQMREEALDDIAGVSAARFSVVVQRDAWHEGIVGLVASRLKERLHRPAFAFAPAASAPGFWRGSGRSIPGIHLRDVLDLVSKRQPLLIERFGGHAMAAGLTLNAANLAAFEAALEAAVEELADPGCFVTQTFTDGALDAADINLDLLTRLESEVWGQGFPEPLFSDRFEIRQQRLVKERHLKLWLRQGTRELSAIFFDRAEPLPQRSRLAYRLMRDDYGARPGVQLQVIAVDD